MEITFRGLMRFAIWVFFIVSFVSHRSRQTCFYRAANAIFAKVGRFASEVVLILTKCLPSLVMDRRCVLCLEKYCSLLILQLIVS